jgi:hypothetical protein
VLDHVRGFAVCLCVQVWVGHAAPRQTLSTNPSTHSG